MAHDGYAEHSHEVRPDHLGVTLEVPGDESDPDQFEAQSDFINEISLPIVKAFRRGVDVEKLRADFEAAISILS
jgi:hypothetical protein